MVHHPVGSFTAHLERPAKAVQRAADSWGLRTGGGSWWRVMALNVLIPTEWGAPQL